MSRPRPRDTTVRRLLERFGPHRQKLLVALLLVGLHSAVPGLLVLLVQVVLDDVLVSRDLAALRWIPFAVVGLYVANGVLGFGRGMLTRTIAWNVLTDLRTEVFAALLRQEPDWHRSQSAGAITSRVLTDVDDIQYGVSAIVTAVQKPLTLAFLLLAAARMSPTLTAVAVVTAPLVVLPVRWLGHQLRERARHGLDARARLSGYTTESLSTLEGLQAARAEPQRRSGFEALNQALRSAALTSFAARLLPSPVVESAAAVGVALVISIGGEQVMQGEMLPGELVAFLLAVGLLNDPLKGLAEVHTLAQRAAAGAGAAFALIDRLPVLRDGPDGPLQTTTAPALSLSGITIDYGHGPVVENLDLTIEAGEIVALAGPSGVGKSSLARLVPRLHDPTQGTVCLGGQDVRRHTLSSVRRQVAWVGQHPILLADTVAANIALSTPKATRADITTAAMLAGAHDFITALPQGYDTRLDEAGGHLSGGERQRICIARAFVQDAPIVVLDEPTSALDARSEQTVQAALDRLCEGRAVLLVAHRQSTLDRAHRVVVLAPVPEPADAPEPADDSAAPQSG